MLYKPHVSLDRRDATKALLANTSESITQLTVEGKDVRRTVTPQTAKVSWTVGHTQKNPLAYTEYATHKYRVDNSKAHTNKISRI